MSTATTLKIETLRTLPTDAARHIQWRFADRYDLQMLVQSVRSVARGPVAKLVAQGGRNTHEWTPAKAEMLEAFDHVGHHSRLHGPGTRRIHRRTTESGACAGGV